MLRRTILVTALIGVLVVAPGTAQAPKVEPVSIRIVKYDELGESIRKLKGQVVVVDFWADFCVPCKREFPKLVALHEKHAKAGLTAISVSLDDPAEGAERVKKFLAGQKAICTNFILDEKPGTWQAKLKIDGPPCVYVFNRQGQLEQKFADKEVDYAAIEKLVAELIQK
jgi:thiol-disulfide isomerase/thioredoxin